MEDNKYYVPNIEEFCVGFEFEVNDLKLNNPSTYNETTKKFEDNWVKVKYDGRGINNLQGYPNNTYITDIDTNRFRVKYLDEQDILDCNFEYTNNNRDLINGDIRVRAYIGKQFRIPNINIFLNRRLVFCGKIKNKTDFKRILKQIETDEQD